MSGRFIGESTRLVYDIMHYVDKNNLQGMLMLIDFQKAFDSVSWSCQMCLTFLTSVKVFANGLKFLIIIYRHQYFSLGSCPNVLVYRWVADRGIR